MTTQQILTAQNHAVLQRLIQQNYITKDWVEKCPTAFRMCASTILPSLSTTEFYPEAENIFRAYKECQYDDVKVVLLGQDPYHDGSATGICFDNLNTQKKKSPSLSNLVQELISDIGSEELMSNYLVKDTKEGTLDYLPSQGVLMINTALTVEPGKPGSHAELWAPFTNEVITELNKKDKVVWILLGNYAKKYKTLITNPTHRFVEAVHPSPLSAHRGFFGSKIFSKTNQALKEMGLTEINW